MASPGVPARVASLPKPWLTRNAHRDHSGLAPPEAEGTICTRSAPLNGTGTLTGTELGALFTRTCEAIARAERFRQTSHASSGTGAVLHAR